MTGRERKKSKKEKIITKSRADTWYGATRVITRDLGAMLSVECNVWE